MRDKSGGGSGFTAPARGFSLGPAGQSSGGAGQGAAATCAGRVWAEIGRFGSLPGEGAREGRGGSLSPERAGRGLSPASRSASTPAPHSAPPSGSAGSGRAAGPGGLRRAGPSLPAGRRRGAAGAGALSPCRRVARSGGGPWRWRRSGDGGGAAAVSPAGSGAERGAGRSGAAPLGPMAFSAWQILSPVQWARWTWSAVRGGGGPEGEDGGAEEDSPALGSRQVTAAPAPTPPCHPRGCPCLSLAARSLPVLSLAARGPQLHRAWGAGGGRGSERSVPPREDAGGLTAAAPGRRARPRPRQRSGAAGRAPLVDAQPAWQRPERSDPGGSAERRAGGVGGMLTMLLHLFSLFHLLASPAGQEGAAAAGIGGRPAREPVWLDV